MASAASGDTEPDTNGGRMADTNIDAIDELIIAELQQDGRRPYTAHAPQRNAWPHARHITNVAKPRRLRNTIA